MEVSMGVIRGGRFIAQFGSAYLLNKNITNEEAQGFRALKSVAGQIDLRHNKLTNLDMFKNLQSANTIYLNNNALTNIKGLRSLKKLQDLYLSNNAIKTLDGLENLTQVRAMYINNISSLKDVSALGMVEVSSGTIYVDGDYEKKAEKKSVFCSGGWSIKNIYGQDQSLSLLCN